MYETRNSSTPIAHFEKRLTDLHDLAERFERNHQAESRLRCSRQTGESIEKLLKKERERQELRRKLYRRFKLCGEDAIADKLRQLDKIIIALKKRQKK